MNEVLAMIGSHGTVCFCSLSSTEYGLVYGTRQEKEVNRAEESGGEQSKEQPDG